VNLEVTDLLVKDRGQDGGARTTILVAAQALRAILLLLRNKVAEAEGVGARIVLLSSGYGFTQMQR